MSNNSTLRIEITTNRNGETFYYPQKLSGIFFKTWKYFKEYNYDDDYLTGNTGFYSIIWFPTFEEAEKFIKEQIPVAPIVNYHYITEN